MERAIKRIQQTVTGKLTLSDESKKFLCREIEVLTRVLISSNSSLEDFEQYHMIFTPVFSEHVRKETLARLDRYSNRNTTLFKKPRNKNEMDWYTGLLFSTKIVAENEGEGDEKLIIISSIIQCVLEKIFEDVKEFTSKKITNEALYNLTYLH